MSRKYTILIAKIVNINTALNNYGYFFMTIGTRLSMVSTI